jgi:hypothetical protein
MSHTDSTEPGSLPELNEARPAPAAEPDDTRTTRERIIDHLTDCVEAGPQSTASIIAALKAVGIAENTIEVNLSRTTAAGLILRTSPGFYVLAPSKPKPEPSPRAEQPPYMVDGRSMQEWIDMLEAWWADRSTWNVEREGPPPDHPDNRLHPVVMKVFANRLEPRIVELERQAAVAKKDAALLQKLLEACGGNYIDGPAIRDVAPVKAMLASRVPLDLIEVTLRSKINRTIGVITNPPLKSWRDPALLQAIGEKWCRHILVPGMVRSWGEAPAATAPQKATEKPKPAPAVVAPPAAESSPAQPFYGSVIVARLQDAAARHNARAAAVAAPPKARSER